MHTPDKPCGNNEETKTTNNEESKASVSNRKSKKALDDGPSILTKDAIKRMATFPAMDQRFTVQVFNFMTKGLQPKSPDKEAPAAVDSKYL